MAAAASDAGATTAIKSLRAWVAHALQRVRGNEEDMDLDQMNVKFKELLMESQVQDFQEAIDIYLRWSFEVGSYVMWIQCKRQQELRGKSPPKRGRANTAREAVWRKMIKGSAIDENEDEDEDDEIEQGMKQNELEHVERSDIAIDTGEWIMPPSTRTFVFQHVGVRAHGSAWDSHTLRLRHDATVKFDNGVAHGSWSATQDGTTLVIKYHYRGDVAAMKQSVYNRIQGTNVFIKVHCDVRYQNILIEV